MLAIAAAAAAARTRRCTRMLEHRLRTFEKFSVESEVDVLEDGVDGAVLLGDGSLQGADEILVFDVLLIDLSAVELPGEAAVIMPEGEKLSPEAFDQGAEIRLSFDGPLEKVRVRD